LLFNAAVIVMLLWILLLVCHFIFIIALIWLGGVIMLAALTVADVM